MEACDREILVDTTPVGLDSATRYTYASYWAARKRGLSCVAGDLATYLDTLGGGERRDAASKVVEQYGRRSHQSGGEHPSQTCTPRTPRRSLSYPAPTGTAPRARDRHIRPTTTCSRAQNSPPYNLLSANTAALTDGS